MPQTKYSQIIGLQNGALFGSQWRSAGRELGKASMRGQGELPVGSVDDGQRCCGDVPDELLCELHGASVYGPAQSVSGVDGEEYEWVW
jgi:hypothetical protein